ncbi:type II toxin-antitoxin system RelE/ParE family toxin [Dokdonella sp.]|uniref:type II toxin-antitoxin system RelE/ParE family toxin n=1 Tax=Dokdonella sp. TaxID=2291710 RepID=UPI0035274BFE
MTFPPIAGGISRTLRGAVNPARDRSERVQRGVAVVSTLLLHVLFALVLMSPPTPITTTEPQGQAGSSAMEVTLLDEEPVSQPPPPWPEPIHRKPMPPKRPKAPRANAPRPPTPVARLDDTSDTPTVLPITEPEPPDTAEPPEKPFGPPPGFRPNDNARANAALAAKLGRKRGRSNNAAPVGRNMGTDGFHVYYDLADENRLRAWRNQGMTELYLPMPGTLRRMVCPLEVALRRGSGECRMVEMDSPELEFIGDAREVINIQRVYRLGKEVWSGPGSYR